MGTRDKMLEMGEAEGSDYVLSMLYESLRINPYALSKMGIHFLLERQHIQKNGILIGQDIVLYDFHFY